MFVSVGTRLKNSLGIGFLAGVRVTKRNAIWMIWIAFFAAIIWLMWKMLVLAAFALYYMVYGLYLFYKYIFLGIVWGFKKAFFFIKGKIEERRSLSDIAE